VAAHEPIGSKLMPTTVGFKLSSAARPGHAVILRYARREKPVERRKRWKLCRSGRRTGERVFAEGFHRLTKLQINLVRNGHHPKQ
jgi:hypothetical protein